MTIYDHSYDPEYDGQCFSGRFKPSAGMPSSHSNEKNSIILYEYDDVRSRIYEVFLSSGGFQI